MIDNLVTFFGCFLVITSQIRHALQYTRLDPWRRHPVVVIIAWEAVVDHLLQDDEKTLHQILVVLRVRPTHFDVMVQRDGHNLGVFVTQGTFHLGVHTFNRDDFVKLHHNEHGFLPDHLVLVGQQLVDHVSHGHHHLLVHHFGQDCQGSEHFEVCLRLQIPLQSGNHKDHHV